MHIICCFSRQGITVLRNFIVMIPKLHMFSYFRLVSIIVDELGSLLGYCKTFYKWAQSLDIVQTMNSPLFKINFLNNIPCREKQDGRKIGVAYHLLVAERWARFRLQGVDSWNV